MPEYARRLADLADAATEQAIAEIVARAPEMTEEQAAKIRRMFRYGPPPADGETPGAETGGSTERYGDQTLRSTTTLGRKSL